MLAWISGVTVERTWYSDLAWIPGAARSSVIASTAACFQIMADPDKQPVTTLMVFALIAHCILGFVMCVVGVEVGQRRS